MKLLIPKNVEGRCRAIHCDHGFRERKSKHASIGDALYDSTCIDMPKALIVTISYVETALPVPDGVLRIVQQRLPRVTPITFVSSCPGSCHNLDGSGRINAQHYMPVRVGDERDLLRGVN